VLTYVLRKHVLRNLGSLFKAKGRKSLSNSLLSNEIDAEAGVHIFRRLGKVVCELRQLYWADLMLHNLDALRKAVV